MKNKFKFPLVIIFIIVLILLVAGGMFILKKSKDEPSKIKVLDVIDGFSYELKENDTELKKTIFKELEKLLKSKDVNYEEYAKLLSKIFIIDVFTLDNKINKYDIGGVDFVLDSEKEKFKNIMSDTLYSYIETKNDKRKQELPEVKDISITSLQNTTVTIDSKEYLAYDINLKWSYKKDLGYDTEGKVTVIKDDNMIYVVSYNKI